MLFPPPAPASLFRLAVSVLAPLFLASPPYRSTLSLGSPATRPTPSLFQLCETLSNGGARLAACIPGASKPGPIRLHTNAEDGELEFIIHFLTRRDLSLFLVPRVLLLEFLPFPFFFFPLAKVEHGNDHFPLQVFVGLEWWVGLTKRFMLGRMCKWLFYFSYWHWWLIRWFIFVEWRRWIF